MLLSNLELIKEIIETEISHDSEGMTYLTQAAFNKIADIVKINNITQDELDSVDKYMLNAKFGGYGFPVAEPIIESTCECEECVDGEFLELKEELHDVIDYMHKSVIDADGFMTDYTWYKTPEGENVFIFGDRELYNIDNSEPDFATNNEEEANDWFNSYVGLMGEAEDSFYDALSELE